MNPDLIYSIVEETVYSVLEEYINEVSGEYIQKKAQSAATTRRATANLAGDIAGRDSAAYKKHDLRAKIASGISKESPEQAKNTVKTNVAIKKAAGEQKRASSEVQTPKKRSIYGRKIDF